MSLETIEHCIAVLEYYAETSSGREYANAKATKNALIELRALKIAHYG